MTLVSTVQAGKSVYVISSTNANKVQAYKVDANSLTYQTEYDTTYGSPVGIAIDESEYGQYLFLTFENQDEIEIVNAKSMQYVDTVIAPQATNLAGLVFDDSKDRLYAINRPTNRLYIYSWDAENRELTLVYGDPYYVELADCQDGYGLALDEENELLYVGDDTNDVKYYDTNDWSKEGEISITDSAIGIAIDVPNQYLYTGAAWLGGSYYLTQYDLGSSTENRVDVGSSVLGIAVDQDTGYVYLTTYGDGTSTTQDRLMVYDPNLTKHWSSDDIGDPAGCAVSDVGYKDPFFSIVKDDNDVDCVYPLISEEEHELFGTPYNWLYYNVAWDANGYADSNVVIVDYLPKGVDEPNLISDGGVYDSNKHTVTWTLGDVSANDSDEFQIRVGVNNWATPGGIITNKVEMEGDEYLSWHIIDTNVCAWGGEIIYVDTDANGFNNGTSWDDAYNLLQDGFTGARNCGASVTAIWVAAGLYKPVYEMDDLSQYKYETFDLIEDVGLFGHFGGVGTYETSTSQRNFADPNNETILEGQIGDNYYDAVCDVVYGDDIEDAIVDGFTITRSYGGAGIYLNSSDASIVNCKLKANYYYGVECYNFSCPDIHNCTFIDNSSYGLYAASSCWPEVSNCIFDGNDTTTEGIYMATYTVVTVDDCVFNDHTSDGIYGSGGTLTITDSTFEGNNDNGIEISDVTTTVTNCSIKNSNDNGIQASNSDLTIDHSVIAHSTDNGLYTSSGCNLTFKNSVVRYSGEDGIELNNNLVTTIKNNWIHNNGTDEYAYYGGAGISFKNQSSVPLVRNNTLYDNYTYGVESSENGADPNVINCIVYGNDSNDFYRENGTFDTVNYCNLQNSHDGTGNITGDPGFANVAIDPNDLHLDETSQCKDAGDPNGDYDETDIDGENRIYYNRVDMGADEYYTSPADFDEDGTVNFIDYAIFAAAWQSEPNDDNYDEDCDLEDNNSIDFEDLALFCEDWLWEQAWDEGWMMCMGGGGFGLESISLMESSLLSLDLSKTASPAKGGDDLMLSASESLITRPERLAAKSQKFYDITPETTISAMQKALEAKEVNIKEILEWLDKIWLSGDLKESLTEEQYLEFRKAIEELGF
jgi:hypothetical protein